ncbi:hypothetical protein [Marinifilum fragile]|nr:hypothetical protein [Marinifilum fragile]
MKKVDNFPVAKCSQWKKLANPCGKMLSMGLEHKNPMAKSSQ